MYIAIPVAVSVFSAYGPVYLLVLNLFLLPVFFHRKKDLLTPLLSVLAAILSFFYISNTLPIVSTPVPATLSLTWSDNAKIDGGRLKGFAKTSTGETIYAVYKFKDEKEKMTFAELNLPSALFTFSGDFLEPDIPSHTYSFDMNRYMKMYGASGIFETEMLLHAEMSTNIGTRLANQRRKVKQHIAAVFPETLVVEAEALLIGDRSGMDEEEASTYRRLGITHLFAISGLHVGLLAFMLRELLLRLALRKETVDMLLMVLLPIYAVLAGGAPSVWRAVSVTVLVLLTSLGERKVRLDDALAVSAIIFILYQPFVVFQPGFQLSYIAAFSLVLSSEILAKAKTFLGASFLVTSISQLALYPILLFHFYELSLSSFFVNIFYVPLYSIIILPANIILLLVTWIYPLAAEVLFVFYVPFREFISFLTNWLASLPYQLWTPGKLSSAETVFAVVGVLYFFVKYEEGALLRRCLPFAVIPALVIHFLPYMDSTWRVTYLDVGQGDSAVIELPHRKAVYVIDTGGTVSFGEDSWKTPEQRFEVGRKIVVPYLKGRGITKIDKLIISHAHADHVEGADEIVEEIRVGEIHITPGSDTEKEMEDLLRIAAKKKVPILRMKDGVYWKDGRTAFKYVGPQDEEYVGNNSSLVLYMNTMGANFLFAGDMEKDAEANFLRKYEKVDFGPIILKAGHHGSKTSSTAPFIEKLQPQLTIFSAGKNNLYGHPHEEVKETFAELGLPTMTTANHGSITVTVKKENVSVSSMAK
ncbi:DNA internalization-related competence protein ComEC/Rec2 [Sporosarcina sp. G11-34]|uniref:DNA internalization-related competence protein ComEC/Rec2 n=1 Tax=Sporosarcina sp. G11-34 TaxID=2849605 RepID=UPI0022A92BF6|nr:DNA internalization-related competence protein ComEC/Rec2 [Sporosarcina sp. G11-34]MCZ2259381.1 DNA internalization-related competence protein ComEC/Rec2 [Sporosarcina sp. G11-34]